MFPLSGSLASALCSGELDLLKPGTACQAALERLIVVVIAQATAVAPPTPSLVVRRWDVGELGVVLWVFLASSPLSLSCLLSLHVRASATVRVSCGTVPSVPNPVHLCSFHGTIGTALVITDTTLLGLWYQTALGDATLIVLDIDGRLAGSVILITTVPFTLLDGMDLLVGRSCLDD